MKTKVAAIYGKRDVRLREFELPEITDNELLVRVLKIGRAVQQEC